GEEEKRKKEKCWQGCGTFVCCWWKCTLMQTLENSMVLLKKLKIELLYDPTIPLLGIYAKELKSGIQTDICTPVFIASFTRAKGEKQTIHPSTEEQTKHSTDTKWSIIQPLKKKETLSRATTWVNLEDIMLSE
ncbi:LORF2 protein, partial [Crocuta crocuta]